MNEPRLLRWQEQMKTVAERWKRQYFVQGQWSSTFRGETRAVFDRLSALDATATPQDVRDIIGVGGWVSFMCNGCYEDVDVAIQLGDAPDYESATVTLCLPCFDKAVELRKAVAAVDPHAASTGKLSTRDKEDESRS